MIGIQLYKDQTKFIQKPMDKKLLTIRAAENVIRILPPLNVKKNELDQALKIIDKVCAKLNETLYLSKRYSSERSQKNFD